MTSRSYVWQCTISDTVSVVATLCFSVLHISYGVGSKCYFCSIELIMMMVIINVIEANAIVII